MYYSTNYAPCYYHVKAFPHHVNLFFADEENEEEVEIEQLNPESTNSSGIPDPYDHVYTNIPKETYMLKDVPNCKHCAAKRFHKEPKGFCCRDGDIKLSNIETPPELMRL